MGSVIPVSLVAAASVEWKLAVGTMELSSDSCVLDWPSGPGSASGGGCGRLGFEGPRLGCLRLTRRGMACGDDRVVAKGQTGL